MTTSLRFDAKLTPIEVRALLLVLKGEPIDKLPGNDLASYRRAVRKLEQSLRR